ncbi:uncharacterized protein LOC131952536 [Physella acuta]|uniref:uncharacterized protein LOC131952536 n=1 Tax=Physella acuta TaxID=109671 RepID=UPI0027DCABF4|nr:uncharacterized protein LOC131952536 [Physella acuta]
MDRSTSEDNFESKNLDIAQKFAPKGLDDSESEPTNQTAQVESAEGDDNYQESHLSNTRQNYVNEQRDYDQYSEYGEEDTNGYDVDSPPPYSDDFRHKTEVSYLQNASTAYHKNASTAYHKVALTNDYKNASAAYDNSASAAYPKNASTAYPKNASTGYPKNASTAYPKNASTAYPKNASTAYPKNASAAYHKRTKHTQSRTSQNYPRNDNSGRQLLQPTAHLPVHGNITSRANVQSVRDEPESQVGCIPSYAGLSLCVMCFCCLPLGVGGLVYSLQANTLKKVHKYAKARAAARKALGLNIAGIVLGITLDVVIVYLFYTYVMRRDPGL